MAFRPEVALSLNGMVAVKKRPSKRGATVVRPWHRSRVYIWVETKRLVPGLPLDQP